MSPDSCPQNGRMGFPNVGYSEMFNWHQLGGISPLRAYWGWGIKPVRGGQVGADFKPTGKLALRKKRPAIYESGFWCSEQLSKCNPDLKSETDRS
jgi:hypothetical protein